MSKLTAKGIELPSRERTHKAKPSGFADLILWAGVLGLAVYKGCFAEPTSESTQMQTVLAETETQQSTRQTVATTLSSNKPRSTEPLRHNRKITHSTRSSARLVLR